MRITDNAANAIVNVMKTKGLNPKDTFLEIGVFEGNLGMSFSKDAMGKMIKHGELTMVISSEVDSTGVVIDFGEVNGKKGLIFLGEQNVNNTN